MLLPSISTRLRLTLRKIIVIGLFAFTGVTVAQQAPSPAPVLPSKYEPTEVERLRLQVAQKDAQLAKVQFLAALAQLDNEAEKVKKAHDWPSTVQFSPDTLTFVEASKPMVAPPVAPAPEQKKP